MRKFLFSLLLLVTSFACVDLATAATVNGTGADYNFSSITSPDPISYTDIYGNVIVITDGHGTIARTIINSEGNPELTISDRPVDLIGSILGITGDEFAQAFSGVTPQPNGAENEAIAQANKAILLAALQGYDSSITNDEIDAVTDYYRFAPGGVEGIWPHTPAEIAALVDGSGVVTGFEIVSGGNGYTTEPTITVNGVEIDVDITLAFTESLSPADFNAAIAANGAIASMSVAAVPEPTSLALLGMAMITALLGRRRRRPNDC